jgi:pimeloyl-ACP methyl ester carboxylesterase
VPTARVNGIELYYQVHGGGEPVLLIMGTGNDHTLWRAQVEAFSTEFRCIAYDNRGTGKTSKPETGYSTEILAEDAAGLLDAMEITAAHVAGWSLGSVVAQELALRHPEKVLSLSLYSTWDRCYSHFRRRFELQGEIAKLGRPDMLRAFAVLTLFSARFLNEHEDEVREFEKRLYAASSPPAERTPLHALLGHYQADINHNAVDRLEQINAPTLIVVGADDPLTRVEYARAVHDRIRGSELVVIEGGDHMLPVTMAPRFNSVALEFLRRVSQHGTGDLSRR